MSRRRGKGKDKKGKKNRDGSKKSAGPRMARTADKYALYQQSVQDPEGDVTLMTRMFKRQYDRDPEILREDFCAAAAMACAWVAANPKHRAIGVDIDPEPLAWGQEHNVALLDREQSSRLELIEGDVLADDDAPTPDVVAAFNFSYLCFTERSVLRTYFEKSFARLHEEGILVLDLYGGAEAQRIQTETREDEGFDYVWDQDVFDPIGHLLTNYIHFEFPDGSKMKKAFRYDWRLWTLPELRDLLKEVGFTQVEVYWEGTDKDTGEGNGVYRPAKRAVDDPAWVTYIVASK